jgi:predicted RNA methylase
MIDDIKINRPIPTEPNKEIKSFSREVDVEFAIEELEAGNQIKLKGFYSNGLILLQELQVHLKKFFPNKSFKEQREYRSEYHKLSNLILIEVAGNKLNIRKAPSIGWLEKLYPEQSNFFLSFPQVQGLNSSWQWYLKGIAVPVLRNKIHPYYGTYFPTRFEHLILFDNWLKRYNGPKKSAIDIGVGSGVLSLQLIKHGFQKVFGTDTNPNAIFGLKEFMGDTKLSRKIELDLGYIFGKWGKPSELIVFNPPWLPKSHDLDRIDEAIYYNENLFPEFFIEAKKRLSTDGRLVVIFSNLAEITNVTKEHPIKKEIENGGRFQLEKYLTRPVKNSSEKTKRDQHWRSFEEVELWVLINK